MTLRPTKTVIDRCVNVPARTLVVHLGEFKSQLVATIVLYIYIYLFIHLFIYFHLLVILCNFLLIVACLQGSVPNGSLYGSFSNLVSSVCVCVGGGKHISLAGSASFPNQMEDVGVLHPCWNKPTVGFPSNAQEI